MGKEHVYSNGSENPHKTENVKSSGKLQNYDIISGGKGHQLSW